MSIRKGADGLALESPAAQGAAARRPLDLIRTGFGVLWFVAQIYILFYPPIPMLARPLHVLIATVLSSLTVRRQLDHLDLVAVLKSKE